MPASVSVKQRTGPSGSPTDTSITNLRMCLADAANDGSAHPIQAPGSGSVNAFVASLFLNADTTPASTIGNIKFYSSGTNPWTGVTLNVATGATYTQASGSGSSGVQLTSGNFPGISTPTNAFGFTSSAPLTVAGSIANPSTGKISDFVMLQGVVSSIAVQGTLAGTTAFFQYDEA